MSAANELHQPPAATANWTFTQGLLLGQASVLLLGLLFVRYVVFSPADYVDSEEYKVRRSEKQKKAMLSATPVPPPVPSQILKKTEYEMATHPPESADWLNVLAAQVSHIPYKRPSGTLDEMLTRQVIQGYRNDMLAAAGEEGARQRIEKWLNPEGGKMNWLARLPSSSMDPIEVTALNLGKAYPLLSNARIRPSDGQGHIVRNAPRGIADSQRAELDIDFVDSVSLNVQTSVLINFPRPRFAVLPVALGVELVSLGGTLSMDIHDPIDQRQHLHACLLPDFHLNLKTTSLLGSRAKLQGGFCALVLGHVLIEDIPKIEQLIISRIRSVVQDRFVSPHHISVALPRLLSPMVSPTPIIADIGESAITVMGDSIKQGFGRMVQDLTDTFNGDILNPSPIDTKPLNGRITTSQPQSPVSPLVTDSITNRPTSPPASPSRPARKITMPAGFPHANGNTLGVRPAATGVSSEDSTPVVTPGVSRDVSPLIRRTHLPSSSGAATEMGMPLGVYAHPPGAPSAASASGYQQRPVPNRGPSTHTQHSVRSHHQPQSLPYAPRQPPQHRQNGSPAAPASGGGMNGDDDQFRFRGQFSSGASGVPPVTPAMDRRVGALNSRGGT